MSKKLSPKMRKTLGVMILSLTLGLGAFSLLKTSVTSTQSNIIATGLQDGQANSIKVIFANDDTNAGLQKYNALPESEETAKKGAKYTFEVQNDGTVKQVVRLKMKENANANSEEKLDTSKVHILITDEAGSNELFRGTMKDAIDGANKGFGNCLILEGTNKTPRKFHLYAYIDENATNEDLYGADHATAPKSLALNFTLEADGIQYDGLFTKTESDASGLITEYETAIAK